MEVEALIAVARAGAGVLDTIFAWTAERGKLLHLVLRLCTTWLTPEYAFLRQGEHFLIPDLLHSGQPIDVD